MAKEKWSTVSVPPRRSRRCAIFYGGEGANPLEMVSLGLAGAGLHHHHRSLHLFLRQQ